MSDIGLIAALAKALGGGGGPSPSGGGGGLVVNITSVEGTLTFDKTWKECYDTLTAGNAVVLKMPDDENAEKSIFVVGAAYYDPSDQAYYISNADNSTWYGTATETGYPVATN